MLGNCQNSYSSKKNHMPQIGTSLNYQKWHKSKKTIISSFELFRVKDRDVPVEVLELEQQDILLD